MLKKVILSLLASVMACLSISTFLASADIGTSSSFDELYNISYYTGKTHLDEGTACKIVSTEELASQFPGFDEIQSKYDEAFFESKFLYRINYHAPNPAWVVKVTDVIDTQDSVSIEVTAESYAVKGSYYPQVIVPWDILLEFDNSYSDKTISSKVLCEIYIDIVCNKAFGLNDKAFIKVHYYPYDKVIAVGDAPLYYNRQKNAYFGLVDVKNLDIGNQSAMIGINNGTPQSFTYGNLVDNNSDKINLSDLYAMKLIIEKGVLPDDRFLIASDLNGDGQCNNTDIQLMKQYLEKDIAFPVLK